MLKKKYIQIPVVVIILLTILIMSIKIVAGNTYNYWLSSHSTTGGRCHSERIAVIGEDKYKLEALANEGYEFAGWEIDGDCAVTWGQLKDTKIEVLLKSNCTATAKFNKTAPAQNSSLEQVDNPPVTAKAVAFAETENNDPTSNYKTGQFIATIAFIVAIFLLSSFLIRYTKVFYSIAKHKKQRKRSRKEGVN